MKEKAIDRGKWQGSGGPKGAKVISELIDWEVRLKNSSSWAYSDQAASWAP